MRRRCVWPAPTPPLRPRSRSQLACAEAQECAPGEVHQVRDDRAASTGVGADVRKQRLRSVNLVAEHQDDRRVDHDRRATGLLDDESATVQSLLEELPPATSRSLGLYRPTRVKDLQCPTRRARGIGQRAQVLPPLCHVGHQPYINRCRGDPQRLQRCAQPRLELRSELVEHAREHPVRLYGLAAAPDECLTELTCDRNAEIRLLGYLERLRQMLDRDRVVRERLEPSELAQHGAARGLIRRLHQRAPQKLDRRVEITAPERRPGGPLSS